VAWPPGPINAEIVRRGLSRGFGPAFALGAGASTADFLWAVAVTLGAGTLADLPGVRPALAVISLTLLLFLAWTYLSGAVRSWRHRGTAADSTPSRFEGTRGGYFLGVSLALSSPWNIAFWLAVVGQQAGDVLSIARSLLLAASVVTAALAWSLVLSIGARLGARFANPSWEIGTRAATGFVMLYFAIRLAIRLRAGGSG